MKEITQSESIQTISKALLKAQIEVDRVTKNAKNPHFKSTYADISAVIDSIKPALNSSGITFLQLPCPSINGEVRLTTRLLHESGEWIDSTITVPISKNDAQGYGSGITYARRYSLAAIMGLPQEDDDGNGASAGNKPAKKPANQTPSGSAFERLSPELKSEAKTAADHVESAMPDIEKASEIFDMFCESFVDNEDVQVGAWNQISAKTRNAIKDHRAAMRNGFK